MFQAIASRLAAIYISFMLSADNPSDSQIKAFHKALHRWYAAHGRRDLPWRNTNNPYEVYISEIMLQQTQVKTVLERFYAPFLKAFPTLAALAAADHQAVAKKWEGLGYYTRAANLHKAAQQSGGMLPGTWEELQKLPGIGRNTASAVACFGFGQAVPVMEANVRRVLCRVFAMKEARDDVLWEKAELLLDKQNPFDYNQAMMDIGAMVCTKRAPRCEICPLAAICKGKIAPESYPAPKKAKITPTRKRVIVVLHDGRGGYFLYKRTTRFLHGLYGFPEYDEGTKTFTLAESEYSLLRKALLGQITQTYSHFTLQAEVYLAKVDAQEAKAAGLQCATRNEIKELPLSGADHKVLALLDTNNQK
ncbi:MAG TPA: A/G-specific adenine glycosylase [Rickettsiales bacterium]|nr:A/G-specific adenine glycosylase [Rickettsiales bacterium]